MTTWRALSAAWSDVLSVADQGGRNEVLRVGGSSFVSLLIRASARRVGCLGDDEAERESAGKRGGDEELEKVSEEVNERGAPTHEISPSMRVLAAPTLSCATAYVLSTSARRPGPTSTAPEAAARERACGSVFWYDEGFCGGCEGRVSEVRGEGEEREGGEGARRAPRAAGGWCLAERQQFQSAVVQTLQDDKPTAQRALDAPLVAAAAHELRLCAMLPPISVADSVRLTG